MKYISQETDQPVTIRCRWHDKPVHRCGTDTTAIALRGQWQGGSNDMNPHWVPVCATHDAQWDVDADTGERLDLKYQLPRIPLTGEASR